MALLAGIRVLDLSRVLAGPWAAQLLADMGAEVIKVERPGAGDDTRSWGPPWVEGPDGARVAAYFLSANRGKKSVAIDFTTPEGARLVRALAKESDVLIENFKVGGLAKYGLDAETLRSANPGLVYCSVTGFGQDGPYSPRAGYDYIIQAMGGLMSITGQPEGEPGGEPMKVGVALADIITGLYAGNAILAALLARGRTGEGAHIDMALLDAQVAVLANQAANFFATGQSPRRLGNAHPNIVPYQPFLVADGEIVVAVGNDQQFRRFCEVLGEAQWAEDKRFATNAARVANRGTLVPMITGQLVRYPRAHWLAQLEAAGIPAGPINSIADVFADPQVLHRGLALKQESDDFGTVTTTACPVRIDGRGQAAALPPPALGAHTRDVLGTLLDLDGAAFDLLKAQGVAG